MAREGGGGGGAGIGGGLFVETGSLALVNCTVTANQSGGGSGGAGGAGAQPSTSGQGIGGGVFNHNGTASTLNSIIAGNSAANGSSDVSGAFSSSGVNLIGNNQGATGLSVNDFQNVPAGLGPLKDNGGPAATHALLQGSLAIGAGTTVGAPATDQRGVPRPSNRIDLGAFQLVTLITPTITWPKPDDIAYGTRLGNPQLNATVSVDGTLTYSPAAGTILPAGSNQILTVVFTPNDLIRYAVATNSVAINVLKADQTINFPTIPNQRIGDPPILLMATASSGLSVTLSVVAGPAILTGNLLTLASSSGVVTVRASQAGNSNYNAAPNLDRTFVLGTLPRPVITIQPSNQSVNPGDRTTFGVVAVNGPLSYQWRFAGGNLVGETGASLVLARVQAPQAGPYDVIVSNPSGSVTSRVALLTVNIAAGTPSIIVQPRNQNVRLGEPATFSVIANGNAPLMYQWHEGVGGDTSRPVPGATNATYTTPVLSASTSFWVSVRNSLGTVDSDTAAVRVFPANAARLELRVVSGLPALIIDGVVGSNYRVEFSNSLSSPNWTSLLTLPLPSKPFTFIDPAAASARTRFYRAVVP